MIRRLLPLAILAILAACTPAPKAVEAPPAAAAAAPVSAANPHATDSAAPAVASMGVAVAFTCADSTLVYALFRNDAAGKPEVAIALDAVRYHLPQVAAASGTRYSDGKTTFSHNGDQAEFSRAGKKLVCHPAK